MVDLPKKKVGIIACSGEELPEGTVTRLAALKVLEQLRPADTVTICLPLFLAGGEGDRAFARFYPTIAVDGCERRCAAQATELYSGKPAASVVVSDLVAEYGLPSPKGARHLDEAGQQAVEVTAGRVAEVVDELLGKRWNRRMGEAVELLPDTRQAGESVQQQEVQATCACGSGIPIQKVMIAGKSVTLVGLPLLLQRLVEDGKLPSQATVQELLDLVKIYNPVPKDEEETYRLALRHEYAAYYQKGEAQ